MWEIFWRNFMKKNPDCCGCILKRDDERGAVFVRDIHQPWLCKIQLRFSQQNSQRRKLHGFKSLLSHKSFAETPLFLGTHIKVLKSLFISQNLKNCLFCSLSWVRPPRQIIIKRLSQSWWILVLTFRRLSFLQAFKACRLNAPKVVLI